MFIYCGNNPVCMKDITGCYPVYAVDDVDTEVVDENEEGVVYRTTITYHIYDSQPGLTEYTIGPLSYSCAYTVTNTGIIVFDNTSNETVIFSNPTILLELAEEMIDVTKQQVSGALSGRTSHGVAFELAVHAGSSAVGFMLDNTDVTQMGAIGKENVGYDYNAHWFEHPIRNFPEIAHAILN